MKGLKGSITVFLALIFPAVLAFVCALLESARISSAVTRAEGITEVSLDSCFAKYGRELFDEYGVLLLWDTDEQILNTYKTVAGLNCDVDRGLNIKGGDIYGLELQEVQIDEVNYCTDDGGTYFEDQIYQYMIQKIGWTSANALLDKINILSQGEKVKGFYNDIKSCRDVFSDAENAVADIKKEIDAIKSIEGDPVAHITAIKEEAVNVNSALGVQQVSAGKERIKEEWNGYTTWSEQIERSLTSISFSISEYKKCAVRAKEAAEKLEKKADEMGKELDADIYNTVKEQVKEIRDKFNENDGYGIDSCKQVTDDLCVKIGSMNEILGEFINSDMDSGEKLNDALSLAGSMDVSALCLNIMDTEVQQVKSHIEDKVSNLWQAGILNLVTDSDDEISESRIDLSSLPSAEITDKDSSDKYNLTEGLIRNAVIGEYILMHFNNYTDASTDTPLSYEVEYILEGGSSDKDNLKGIAEKLIAVRSGFNLISIFRDSAKTKEAYVMAVTAVGVTGMPLVIKVVQIGIIIAWSSAEAIADVKNLLKGKKVALIKSSGQWNLSLDNITDLDGVDKKKDDEQGLSYKDYLRYLLSMMDKQKRLYRIMDVVEFNISSKYNQNFKMKDCITSLKLTSEYKIKKLFSVPVPSVNLEDIYHIKVSRKYSY